MAMQAAGASALIQALNSKKTVQATGNMVKAVNGINEAGQNQVWESIEGITSNLKGSMPILLLMKVVFAEIQKDTVKKTLQLMKDMLDLMDNAAEQLVLTGLTTVLNAAADSSSDLIQLFNNLVKNLPGVEAGLQGMNEELKNTDKNLAGWAATAAGFDSDMPKTVNSVWDIFLELTKTKEGMAKITAGFNELIIDMVNNLIDAWNLLHPFNKIPIRVEDPIVAETSAENRGSRTDFSQEDLF